MLEFSAMALGRSSLPTISATNDWRVGMSNDANRPDKPGEEQDVPDLHRPAHGQNAQTKRDEDQAALGHQEQLALVHAVGHDARQQRKQEDRQAAGEVDPARIEVRGRFHGGRVAALEPPAAAPQAP